MLLTGRRLSRHGVSVKLILLVLAGLVASGYAGVSIWANYRLESRLEKLRAAGEPTCIADLDPAKLKGTNGADVLAKVGRDVEDFDKEYGRFYKSDLGKAYQEIEDDEIPTEEQAAAMRAILGKYPQIELALREAVKCDYYRSRLDYSCGAGVMVALQLPRFQHSRVFARMLRWKIGVLLAEGQLIEAVDAGILMLEFSRLEEQEPTMTGGLIAVAIRSQGVKLLSQALRTGSISADEHANLDHILAEFDSLDWYVKVLKTERAFNLSAAQELFRRFPMTWQGTLLQVDFLDLYEKYLPMADKPAYQSQKVAARLSHNLSHNEPSTPISASLVQLFYPAIQAANAAANRSLAEVRCLRVLNALQAYQQSHGKEASGLADLDLPAAATIDPFDGKPLKLKRTDAGWVIYSVYQDGKDDGGKLAEMQDCGLAPPGYKE